MVSYSIYAERMVLPEPDGIGIFRGFFFMNAGGVMRIKAIVVDNSEELLDKLTGILREMEGIELVGSFGEAIAAIQYVKENPVDLVFSDVVMPDISGITLASKLYQLPDPPEVVLLSGIPGFSLEAWKIRAFGFIIKPYTRAQIAGMVNRYRCEKELERA